MIGSPRVRCEDCDFEWFGRSSAHGLRILGHCPRCSGRLVFIEAGSLTLPPESDENLAVEPSRILGHPSPR